MVYKGQWGQIKQLHLYLLCLSYSSLKTLAFSIHFLINLINCFLNGDHFLSLVKKIWLCSCRTETADCGERRIRWGLIFWVWGRQLINKYTWRATYRSDIFSFWVYISDISVLGAWLQVVPSQSRSQSSAIILFDTVGTFLMSFLSLLFISWHCYLPDSLWN